MEFQGDGEKRMQESGAGLNPGCNQYMPVSRHPQKKVVEGEDDARAGSEGGEHGRAGPNRVSWAISVDPPCWLAALPLKVLGRTGARPAWAPMMTKVGTAS